MSERKLRRKTILFTLGTVALGWLGAKASVNNGETRPVTVNSEEAAKQNRVRPDTRAIPCSGRTL